MILDELGIKIEEEPAPFKDVGERIKQARKFKRYTQFEVADWLGIDFVKYSHFEQGRELPDKKLTMKIGKLLDSDYEYLLYGKRLCYDCQQKQTSSKKNSAPF